MNMPCNRHYPWRQPTSVKPKNTKSIWKKCDRKYEHNMKYEIHIQNIQTCEMRQTIIISYWLHMFSYLWAWDPGPVPKMVTCLSPGPALAAILGSGPGFQAQKYYQKSEISLKSKWFCKFAKFRWFFLFKRELRVLCSWASARCRGFCCSLELLLQSYSWALEHRPVRSTPVVE